jgi:hypothetical protein
MRNRTANSTSSSSLEEVHGVIFVFHLCLGHVRRRGEKDSSRSLHGGGEKMPLHKIMSAWCRAIWESLLSVVIGTSVTRSLRATG